jgi:hypothetical protein
MSYRIPLKRTENSNKFRQAALHFLKHGMYTLLPKGSTVYKKFWDEEFRRCVEGYTADDGDYITGYYYFYLNYCQIVLNRTKTFINNGKEITRLGRVKDFPRFYDYDRAFFDTVEYCEQESKHLVTLKKRKSGYSFKGSAMLCRNFYFIKESTSIVVASGEEFLIKDGVLSKAWDIMAFIDSNTPFGKKKQAINQIMHKRASIVVDRGGIKIEEGYKSEIMGVTLKNDVQKIRGKRAKLILFEEAGMFNGLKEAWQIARPSVENDDGTTFGILIGYGTGGSEDVNFEGLKDLFYEPDAYNALAIENIWDEDADKPCGFFVPQYYNMEGKDEQGRPFMDADGNSFVEISKEFELKQRDKILASATDKNTIDRYVAEKPMYTYEATLSISKNIFPKKELMNHLSWIRTNRKISTLKTVGDLIFNNAGAVEFQATDRPNDITKYRLTDKDDKRGQVVIWEHPIESPPWGLYILAVDPYDHDSSSTTSLGSCLVYKRFYTLGNTHDIFVAEYTGRPDTADEFYENVRKLAIYYKGTVLYENQNKGMFMHFAHKHCEYLLADQPSIIKDIVKDSTVTRGKGIHMTKEIKKWMEIAIRDYLNEEFEPGKKNLTTIYSEPLLEELIGYSSTDGNWDRVISMGIALLYKAQLFNIAAKPKVSIDSKLLFKDGLFRENHIQNTSPYNLINIK